MSFVTVPPFLRYQESRFWRWWRSSKGSFGENPEGVKHERCLASSGIKHTLTPTCVTDWPWPSVAALTVGPLQLAKLCSLTWGPRASPARWSWLRTTWGENAQEMKKSHREKHGERKQFSHMCVQEEQCLRKATIGRISFETAWFWKLQLCYGLQSYLHNDCN